MTTHETPDIVVAGRYALTGPIGHGAMGEVDRAFDNELRRAVAIKRLLPGPGGPSEARRARLTREARAVAQLNHPNVVAVYDVGEFEGTGFVVMELVLGGSLADRLRSGERWSLVQALDWLTDVGHALGAAHRAGLVHRDIKPANLLLTPEGRIKVADFGVVRDLDANSVRAGVVGTLRYMAPEQLRGEAVDGRSDQYAWGVLAYELLSGIHPYDATTDCTVPSDVVAAGAFVPRSLVARVPELSCEIEQVVFRALAPDPAGRFADMNTVTAALHAARHAKPIAATMVVRPLANAPFQATLPIADAPTVQPLLARPRRKGHATIALLGGFGLVLLGTAFVGKTIYNRKHAAVLATSVATAAAGLAAAPVASALCGPDGEVNATVVSGGIIYLGGSFTTISCPTGSGLMLDPATGGKPSGGDWPIIAGSVDVAIPDPASPGGYYIGGEFSRVGTFATQGIARILPDGNVDTSFSPKADGKVSALAVSDGTLYVGGHFQSINGEKRHYLAGIETATGKMTAFDPRPDYHVDALAIAGTTLYVGGFFDEIGGEPRKSLAALDVSTSRATGWKPGPDDKVDGLLVSGNTLYAVGRFHRASGNARNGAASWNRSTGNLTSFDPHSDERVLALAVSGNGNTVYVGGEFKTIGGKKRGRLAALDAATGNATTWEAPPVGYGVKTVAVSASTVYVGGRFTTVGGMERLRVAAFDATTGATTDFDPKPSNTVSTLAISGANLYVGGDFTGMGGETRRNLAALDATTGKVTAWNANLSESGAVYALVASGDVVYAAGSFRTAGSMKIGGLVALDTKTGVAKDWNPTIGGGSVRSLALSGGVLYAGGWFKTVGTLPRSGLAAINTTTGEALPWDPKVAFARSYDGIDSLALSKNALYVAGELTAVGDMPRKHVAAIDLTTAEATAFDPQADDRVLALAVVAGTVYVAGRFESIGGQRRKYLAALEAGSGQATATRLDAMAPGACGALAVSKDVLFAGCGGDGGMLAFDTRAGTYLAFNPHIKGSVATIAVDGGIAYVGGSFQLAGGLPRGNVVALNASTATSY